MTNFEASFTKQDNFYCQLSYSELIVILSLILSI